MSLRLGDFSKKGSEGVLGITEWIIVIAIIGVVAYALVNIVRTVAG